MCPKRELDLAYNASKKDMREVSHFGAYKLAKATDFNTIKTETDSLGAMKTLTPDLVS